MIAIIKCLLVLGFTFLLVVALSGVGMVLGSVEVGLMVLVALVVMFFVVRADRRGHGG